MLRLFGAPHVDLANTPPLPDKAYVLLSTLILDYTGKTTRRVLASTLWPEANLHDASTSMRRIVLQIRHWQATTGQLLVEVDNSLVARTSACMRSDLDDLLEIGCTGYGRAATLLKTIRGQLLDFQIPFEGQLEGRIDQQRFSTTKLLKRLLLPLVESEDTAAEASLSLLNKLGAYDDDVCIAEMRRSVRDGSPRDALSTFRSYRRRLAADLDTIPDAPITDLARAISTEYPLDPKTRPVLRVPRLLILPPNESQCGRNRSRIASFVEDLTVCVSSHRSLEVIAARTALRCSEHHAGTDAIVSRADYLVEMSPRVLEGKQTLLITLLKARSQTILWSERFDFTNISGADTRQRSLQSICEFVIRYVEAETLASASGDPGDGYFDYLSGKRRLLRLDLAQVRRGRRELRSSVQAAPHFAPAHSWLARSYFIEWMLLARPNTDLLDYAEAAAARAIELNPLDGEGYRELGRAAYFRGAHERGIAEIYMAVQKSPNNADLLADSADCLVHHSDIDAAASHIYRALELNPVAPDQYYWTAGAVEFFSGRFSSALDMLSKMANPAPAARIFAASAAMAGRSDLVKTYRAEVLAIYPDFDAARWVESIPQRKSVHREMYKEALRQAGL